MASTHANRGKAWETLLAYQHDLYVRRGAALIHKNEPGVVRNLGHRDARLRARLKQLVAQLQQLDGGLFVARMGSQTLPDYTIVSRNWALLADAKESRENYWPFGLLEPHQAEDFDRIEAQGVRCAGLLLIHAPKLQRAFVVAWADVRERWWAWRQRQILGQKSAPGEGSLSWEDAGEFALWTGRTVFEPLDYLPATLDALEARLAQRTAP